MPPQSTMSSDETDLLRGVLIASSEIIVITNTVVCIYYADPVPNSWTFSGVQGVLALVKDKNDGLYYFRLEEGILFHSFADEDCMTGLVYTNENQANLSFEVVTRMCDKFGAPCRYRGKVEMVATTGHIT
ncbi:hypothetical protein DFH11DRAFT_1728021 [Phellopilus nigrolimitatus]|nr:hypothetical protein DFH11DRAFT_1728021 [Phellopilus nigrolimitatus]